MSVYATVKVLRFDPSVDVEPYYQDYEITDYDNASSGPLTALKALHWINRYVEDVAYEYNCRKGYCGMCGMMINGQAKLACETTIKEGDAATLEPLAGFPVVRDLVVDTSKAYDKIVKSSVNIKTTSPDKVLQPVENSYQWYVELTPHTFCRECFLCYSSCTALQNANRWGSYAGPAAMHQIHLRHVDGIDESDRIAQAVDMGLFECMKCGMCTQVCPAGITTYENNLEMMEEAEKRGLKPESSDSKASYWPML